MDKYPTDNDPFKTTPEGKVVSEYLTPVLAGIPSQYVGHNVTCGSGIAGVESEELETISLEDLEAETEEIARALLLEVLDPRMTSTEASGITELIIERMRDEGLV